MRLGLPLLLLLCFGIALWGLGRSAPAKGRGAGKAAVQPARLEAHVRMLAETLAPRDGAHPENLDRVAAYIRREFAKAGAEVEDQPFRVGGETYRNVIARFGPESKERIVVGAHYDAAGPLPGADDNASGVAGLIELAYLLGKSSLPMRVELVAYSLEEPPYFGSSQMGSAFHARSLKEREVKVKAMICLEMIGYFSDEEGSQGFPLPALRLRYPSRGNFIVVSGKLGQGRLVRRLTKRMKRAAPLPVYSITAPLSLPGIDFSDHRSYWAAGYEAVMITDSAFYRNPHYHTWLDTPDTLDYERMALVVQGVHAAVLAEAE